MRAHLIADVPVGVVSFQRAGFSRDRRTWPRRVQPGIRSFTLAFPGTAFDESDLAREVAKNAGTQHTEVPLDGATVLSRLDEAVGALDQPTMDGINTYFVSWAAREVGLKVALSGLGGDELFAGYRTFSDTAKFQQVMKLAWFAPAPVRRAMLRHSCEAWRLEEMGRTRRAKLAAAWLSPDRLPHPYFFARALFATTRLSRLTDPRFRPSSVHADGVTLDPTWLGWLERAADEARKLEPIGGVSWLELRCYMASTLLRDTDSVSMARSLEVRVPLLDTPLVEFVNSLPDAARYREGQQKALLVEAVGRFVACGNFGAAQSARLRCRGRNGCGGRCVRGWREVLGIWRRRWRPVCVQEGVREVWSDFLAGKTSWSRPWSLYVLNEWCRRNL